MENEKRLIDANSLMSKARWMEEPDGSGIPFDIMAVSTIAIENAPTVKAVPLADIYRVVAGHSNYHGDNILSALTCIAEGKEVKPVKPLPTVEVVHGHWDDYSSKFDKGMDLRCSVCGNRADKFVGGTEDWYCLWKPNYCPNCGAKMDGDGNELAEYLISAGLVIPSETMPSNPYWGNVCTIAEKQRAKGIETYGQGIEMNPADAITRIEYLQEELIDALMYCEWIKDSIKTED